MADDPLERFESIIDSREVSNARLSFDGPIARLDFPDDDLAIEFESAQDDPDATWKGGSLLLPTSRVHVHDGGDTFEVPIDGAATIELAGVPRPDDWD